jgi:hypothetical protein
VRRGGFSFDSAWHVTGLYLAITLVMTWPLAQGLTRDVPSDLGDPILNMWILGWHAHQFQRLLAGDFGVIGTYWDANIFHPHPLTLAYSEHLFPQALQAMPIYALTGNLILGYNLVFLSTFVLSGLGAYLRATAHGPAGGGSWRACCSRSRSSAPPISGICRSCPPSGCRSRFGACGGTSTKAASGRSPARRSRSSRRTCRAVTTCISSA